MNRGARVRSLILFSWFSEEKTPLHRTRVGCLARSFSVCVCHCCAIVSSCMTQHCFHRRMSTELNAHTAPMPAPAGSVPAHTQTKPSRAGAIGVDPELTELQ